MCKHKIWLIVIFATILITAPIGNSRVSAVSGLPDFSTFYSGGGQITENTPPISNAGEDQTVDTLTLVTLDGSLSSDPDGNLPLAFQWTQLGGTTVTLSNATIVNPTFTAPGDPEVLVFSLLVTDSEGAPSETQDEVIITVENQAPLSNAGPDQSVFTATLLTLDGSASYDPDNDTPLTYLWTQTGGSTMVTLDDPTSATPSFTAPAVYDELVFSLDVADGLGLADPTPDTVIITVNYTTFPEIFLTTILRSPEFGIPPVAFNKISPFNGAIYQSATPTLSWGATTPVTRYEYCYDKTNDNACSTWISAGTATVVTLPALSLATTYYWQVRAWNDSVGPTYANGSITSYWSFTTTPTIPPPNTILNGGFESGDVNWTQYSSIGWDLIVNTSQEIPSPHSGSWLAWLGGDDYETSIITQTVAIPVGRSILHYWFASGSDDECDYDYFRIYVGSELKYIQTLCYTTQTESWVHRTLDLTAFAGMSKTIKFEVTTDEAIPSGVVLDDISLEATASLSPGLEVEGLENPLVDLNWLFIKKEGGE